MLVVVAGLAWAAVALALWRGAGWASLALLCVLAIGFEEGSRWSARLKIRLGSTLRADMTSVWVVAAAVVFPPGAAVVLVVVVLGYVWFRHQRPAGERLHRKTFVLATALLGCLSAHAVAIALAGGRLSGPTGFAWGVRGPADATGVLIATVAAIVTYTVVNRALVTVLIVADGARGTALLGTRDDNLIELATLCLGGLLALALLHQPWLAILVLPPIISLQRGALVRDLETAASTDAKTGLLNAIVWEQLAGREIARAQRRRESLSVLLVDIDHFKRVNDHHGHLAGDTALHAVSGALRSALRGYDAIGRFGGEEFVAVLPGLDAAAAVRAAERLRMRVGALDLGELVGDSDAARAEDAPLSLTVSVGVACLPAGGVAELSDLLLAADGALYEAKNSGRNRVCLAGDEVATAGVDGGDPPRHTTSA